MQRIIEIDGDYWPYSDTECRPAALAQYKDLDVAIAQCRSKDAIIQAGGNCGIFPRYLAGVFKRVYTFEPDADNFLCLNMNAKEKNITLDWYPIGTGPYVLSENNPNEQMILTKNPHFHGEKYCVGKRQCDGPSL